MNRIYVALDLETTGLDAERDAILEVGAVRFRTHFDGGVVRAEVMDKWESLVNPGRPIPIQIQQLTGITQEAVGRAPRFSQVAQAVRRFVGSYPVVGHNVGFDLGFLQYHDLPLTNLPIDTFELASIVKPHAARYSLAKLVEALGLPSATAHRALADAMMVKDLFVALVDEAAHLPQVVLREINRAARGVEWPLAEVFRDLERSQAQAPFRGAIGQQLASRLEASEDGLGPLFSVEQEEEELTRAPQPSALDVDALAAMLEEGGVFAQRFPGFEYRPQQVEMLRAVATAFNEHQHLLVEAGTGTGKSIAYLLPAAVFAHMNGERVVISTNTINLQDQLLLKDSPELQNLLPFAFRVAVLKGRGNYLCQRRLVALRAAGVTSVEEMRLLAKVMVWLPSTQTGEQGELFIPDRAEQVAWGRISAESDTCTMERCRFRERGRCFFYRARRAAERAHLLIVNHALLLSDVAVANRVLPDYRYLIVDEAHHLESSVTNQLSFQVDQRGLERVLNDVAHVQAVGHSTGFLALVLDGCRGKIEPGRWALLEGHVRQLQRHVEGALTATYAFFGVLGEFLRGHRQQRGEYDQRLRLTSALRVQPAWDDVEIAWENLAARLQLLIDGLDALGSSLSEMEGCEIADLEGMAGECLGYASRLREMRAGINVCIAEPSPAQICWATLSSRDERVVLQAAPLHVGSLVQKHLFHSKEMVILTSATLTTDRSFEFLRGRLAAWDADELAVGSPFDYKESTLLFLPTDIPEPSELRYQKTVEQALIALCRATEGRVLVLFTSHAQLQSTARAVSQPLAESNIIVYQQGAGGSRAQLLESFRTTPRSVLMGTRSFWEGIDVVGPALSVLVIARLPFSVPDDPIFAARSESFDNPFAEYAVPEAILRFRQGFGRLIRTKMDRGVVVVLDRRILSKSYGPMFLNSLPECTVVQAPLAGLPEAARRWLAKPGGDGSGAAARESKYSRRHQE